MLLHQKSSLGEPTAMPHRLNPYLVLPSDGSRSPSPHDGWSDVSLDEYGQCRGAGGGQALPADENSRYIYTSQIGMPLFATSSPPLLSPGVIPQVEANPLVLKFLFLVCVLTFENRSLLETMIILIQVFHPDIWLIA
jgi:hypothetical protein